MPTVDVGGDDKAEQSVWIIVTDVLHEMRGDPDREAGPMAIAAVEDQTVMGDDRLALAILPDVLAQRVKCLTLHERENLGA